MVKLKALLLLLALNAAGSAYNDTTKKENKHFPQELLSESNVKVSKEPLRKHQISSILRHPKESQLSAKYFVELYETPKYGNKSVDAKNSFESHKNRLRKNQKMRSRHFRSKKSLDKPLANCTKIKCPLIERPVCAKIVLRNTKESNYSQPFYVIMINKCEMNYAKCHRGLEATIVPMKNCHQKFKKTTFTTAKGKRRPKRNAGWNGEEQHMKLNYVANATHLQRNGPTDEEVWKNDLKGEDDGGDDTAAYGNPEYEFEPHTGEIVPVEVDYTNTTDSADEDQETEKVEPDYNTPYDGGIPSTASFDDVTTPSHDRDHHTDENDNVESEVKAACPTSCPLRDIMVCAMCQHKIYKTFASVCHMRKFQCYYKDERLELVSRYPCVMSAPFLSEPLPMKLEGQLSEAGDVDHITRYIRCRERGRLNKTSRCTFEENLNQLSDFKNGEKLNFVDDDTKKWNLNKPVKPKGSEYIENDSQRFRYDYY